MLQEHTHNMMCPQGVSAHTALAACTGVLFHSGFGGQLLNLRLGENGVGLSQGVLPSA